MEVMVERLNQIIEVLRPYMANITIAVLIDEGVNLVGRLTFWMLANPLYSVAILGFGVGFMAGVIMLPRILEAIRNWVERVRVESGRLFIAINDLLDDLETARANNAGGRLPAIGIAN